MTDTRDPWHVTFIVALVMIVLHLTIVPAAWIAAQILDLAEHLRTRRTAAAGS
jgi:hypothetical protein